MTTEPEKKEEVQEEVKAEEKPKVPPPVSIQELVNAYPNDREKARDTLFMGIHNELNRIANALEYFATQDVAEKKSKKFQTGPG
jgi:ATP-dependent protease Clp ATPase subunit